MEGEVEISYESERGAKAVAEAISPDNVKVPHGLFIKTKQIGSEVLTQIRCDLKLQTFIATIDDLLCCISTAEKAFRAVKTMEIHFQQSRAHTLPDRPHRC